MKIDLDKDVLRDPWNLVFYFILIIGKENWEDRTKKHMAYIMNHTEDGWFGKRIAYEDQV